MDAESIQKLNLSKMIFRCLSKYNLSIVSGYTVLQVIVATLVFWLKKNHNNSNFGSIHVEQFIFKDIPHSLLS